MNIKAISFAMVFTWWGTAANALQVGGRSAATPLRESSTPFRTNYQSVPSPAARSPLFASAVADEETGDAAIVNEQSSPPSSSIMSRIPRWTVPAGIFAVGYGLGKVVIKNQPDKAIASRISFAQLFLVFFIGRDLWRSTPQWIKPRVTRFFRRIISVFRMGLGEDSSILDEIDEEVGDVDDITDFSILALKLQGAMDVAKKNLRLDDEGELTVSDCAEDLDASVKSTKNSDSKKDDFNVQASLLALLQLMWQVKSRRASARDQFYRFAGISAPDDVLEGMDEMFELADLAYDEHLSGKPLKAVLDEMGYRLIKHDKTAVPGYLGHYVAISNSNLPNSTKTAIIGVKGTSNFEDFLTDMCGSAVEHELDNPFYDGGNTTFRCHEGMLISSRRLCEDLQPLVENLLIPSGYEIKIVGHSLGAGCATILAIILRSFLPTLQANESEGKERLKVWAFASPPVLDLDSARACESFVTTVVNNVDIIPRANISPLVVTTRLLRTVNKRLKEKNLDMSNFKSSIAFLNKLREGKDGEMLMAADEIMAELDSSLARVELRDSDHLYVPGKAVVLYDLWELEEKKESQREETSDSEELNIPTAEDAIISDGTCDVLRYIELDGRMFDDHMAPAYRSSIAAILSKRKIEIEEQANIV